MIFRLWLYMKLCRYMIYVMLCINLSHQSHNSVWKRASAGSILPVYNYRMVRCLLILTSQYFFHHSKVKQLKPLMPIEADLKMADLQNPRIDWAWGCLVNLPAYLYISGHKANVLKVRWKILELTEHKVAVVTQRGQGQATQVTQLSHFLRKDSTTLPVCLAYVEVINK